MPTILYSPKTKEDLDDIYNYISTNLNNPTAASNLVNQIINAASTLKDNPHIGKKLILPPEI